MSETKGTYLGIEIGSTRIKAVSIDVTPYPFYLKGGK